MGNATSPSPCIRLATLSDTSQPEVDFRDTSFFQHGPTSSRQLPTPAEVFKRSGSAGRAVIVFEELNLAVKMDHPKYLRLEEAQTMRAIRNAFRHGEVPVPEVFGWRKTEERNYIYLELIRGQTLRAAWSFLTEVDKNSIAVELSRIVSSMRTVTHDSNEAVLIGGWACDPLYSQLCLASAS